MWCYVILVVLTVGLGALIATVISTSGDSEVTGMISAETAQSTWLTMSTAGVGFAQLVIAVLGALVITGEYATGMIRSTFAAVPRRLPALLGKILVFGFVSFVVALAALVVTALLVVPIFAAADLELDIADPAVWLGLVGAAAVVALVGLMSLGIGAIIRNSAGAIAAALGLLLVAPTILQVLGGLTRAEWALNAAVFLPSSVGSQLLELPERAGRVAGGVLPADRSRTARGSPRAARLGRRSAHRRSGAHEAAGQLADRSQVSHSERAETGTMSDGPRILIVDDEPNIRDLLTTSLRFAGFAVRAVGNGAQAISAVLEEEPDLIILDVMLPDMNGFGVTKRLRASGYTAPILFLTAKDDTEDKITGLTVGGDDYVTKPFSLDEIVARLKAILRRTMHDEEDAVIRTGELTMDQDTHEVTVGEEQVELSPTEFKLLRYLMLNPNRVLSKAQILDHVWEYDFNGDAGIVEKLHLVPAT